MKVNQIHYSGAVKGLGKKFAEKYNLRPYTDVRKPVVIFGLYGFKDYYVLRKNKLRCIVIFCGSDALKIGQAEADIIKRKNPIIYAMSKFLSDDLREWDIPHKTLPLTPTTPDDISCQPRGNKMYCYIKGENKAGYNKDLAQKVADKTGLDVIFAKLNQYSKEELMEVYKQCFIGLRLTKHDGLPNTVMELGLMGRRSIYNGGTPQSIPWEGLDDICESVMVEYEHRHEPNEFISESIRNYLNIGEEWLNL